MSGQFKLMREQRFLPFFFTQFFGALNDNLYKNALVILLTFDAALAAGLDAQLLVNLAAGIFILPFFLFSAMSGQVADKFEKTRIIRLVKVLEIGIMALAFAGFTSRSLAMLLGALFLLGLHSTLFGPVKYAILPQHLKETELVGGNALVEAGTFVAILVGTIAGGILVSLPGGPQKASLAALVVAVAGYLVSRAIPLAPAADPGLEIDWNPFSGTWKNLKYARESRAVFLSILGISWFWAYGALLLAQFPGLAKSVLGGDEHAVTLLLAVFSVGIGVGSLLCERLSGKHVEIGLVPFGSIGLSLFGCDFWLATTHLAAGPHPLALGTLLAQPAIWRVVFDLLLLGVFGGFYIVPLYAMMQTRSAPEQRSRIIAANNIVNALFMVVASLAGAALLAAGVRIPELILTAALLNALVAIYIYRLVPEFLIRFLAWLLVHSVYRLRVEHGERIPEGGPALLVCNHVSYVDALVIMAASPRPIRFVSDRRYFAKPLLAYVLRHSGAIAFADGDPAQAERAFAEIDGALAAGDLVAIFPEEGISNTGELQPFRPLVERIVARRPVDVVPIALHGLWGSFFSRAHGPAMSAPSKARPLMRIALVVGAPIAPPLASAERVRGAVAALRVDPP